MDHSVEWRAAGLPPSQPVPHMPTIEAMESPDGEPWIQITVEEMNFIYTFWLSVSDGKAQEFFNRGTQIAEALEEGEPTLAVPEKRLYLPGQGLK